MRIDALHIIYEKLKFVIEVGPWTKIRFKVQKTKACKIIIYPKFKNSAIYKLIRSLNHLNVINSVFHLSFFL